MAGNLSTTPLTSEPETRRDKILVWRYDATVRSLGGVVTINFRPWQVKVLSFLGLLLATPLVIGLVLDPPKWAPVIGWAWMEQFYAVVMALVGVCGYVKLASILLSVQRITLDPSKDTFHWKERTLVGRRDQTGNYKESTQLVIHKDEHSSFFGLIAEHGLWLVNREQGWRFKIAAAYSKKSAERVKEKLSESIGLPPTPLWKKRQVGGSSA